MIVWLMPLPLPLVLDTFRLKRYFAGALNESDYHMLRLSSRISSGRIPLSCTCTTPEAIGMEEDERLRSPRRVHQLLKN